MREHKHMGNMLTHFVCPIMTKKTRLDNNFFTWTNDPSNDPDLILNTVLSNEEVVNNNVVESEEFFKDAVEQVSSFDLLRKYGMLLQGSPHYNAQVILDSGNPLSIFYFLPYKLDQALAKSTFEVFLQKEYDEIYSPKTCMELLKHLSRFGHYFGDITGVDKSPSYQRWMEEAEESSEEEDDEEEEEEEGEEEEEEEDDEEEEDEDKENEDEDDDDEEEDEDEDEEEEEEDEEEEEE